MSDVLQSISTVGRGLPTEVALTILELLPRSTRLGLKLVNRAWEDVVAQHLAPHAALGLSPIHLGP